MFETPKLDSLDVVPVERIERICVLFVDDLNMVWFVDDQLIYGYTNMHFVSLRLLSHVN